MVISVSGTCGIVSSFRKIKSHIDRTGNVCSGPWPCERISHGFIQDTLVVKYKFNTGRPTSYGPQHRR